MQLKSNLNLRDEKFLLGIILLIGFVLRFWRFWELDFMHDEISALQRLDYPTWNEFFEKGIKLDGHPAGVQLYLKFHQFLFGINEFGIKFPFLIMGMITLYQVFKIGKEWFSTSTGLLAVAFFAVAQHTIFYHIIIRPYTPGLLFCLLLIRVWTKIFFQKESSWKVYIQYAIYLALTGYSHYFALLFGVILSLTGLFWLKKDQILKYVSAGVLGFLLFSPHLGILFYQLTQGDNVDWLPLTSVKDSFNYYYYVFNYSAYYLFFVIAITLVFQIKKEFRLRIKGVVKRRITMLFLAISSFAIAVWYSHQFKPVFQYSILLFSFPCAVLFVFSFWGNYKKWLVNVGLLGIVILGVISLVFERQHYKTTFERPVKRYYDLVSREGNVLNIGMHEEGMLKFYQNESSKDFEYFTFDNDCLSIKEFQTLLQNKKYEKVVSGNLSDKQNALIAAYFPNVELVDRGVGFDNYLFTRNPSRDSFYVSKKDFQFEEIDAGLFQKGLYGFNRKFPLDSLLNDDHDIIDVFIQVEFETEDPENQMVSVLKIKKGNEQIAWIGANSNDFKGDSSSYWLVNSYHSSLESLDSINVESHLWNRGKTSYKVLNYGYGLRRSNPNIFALYSPLKD